ncbi:MAG: porin [Tepidisphaeraceae bacterium]
MKRLVRILTVCVLLSAGSDALAQEPPANVQGTPMPDAVEPPPAPARRPLMRALDNAGIGETLDDTGINIFGHVEGSYTYNFNDPAGDINVGRVFDFEHDELTLNQIDLTIEKTVDVTHKKVEFGGRVEWLYGGDSGLIHSNGLFDEYDGVRDPENQFDLNQAYVDVAIPVGNGLRIRAGKFVTLLGYEVINPTGNALYSHSYLFGFAIPFTHTGVLATYSLNDKITLNGGVTRGWEQSLEDNNDAIDFLGGVNWVINDKFTLYFSDSFGPQQADNESNLRNVFDFCLYYTVNDDLKLGLNGVYGFEQDVPGVGDADWYGLAGYAHLTVNERATLNARLEWFDDADGTRGIGGAVYEAALGVALKPFPNDDLGSNLLIRPEVRVDYSEDGIFDGGTDHSQVTAAIDAIFTF